MPSSEQVRLDYDHSAAAYGDYGALPSGQLESELIKLALGDCANMTVLDLGGGTGVHAIEALDLGAAVVDLVDISPGMLEKARRSEALVGREDKIRFFEADVSRPLSHLPLREGGYDVVMGNWIFSFADSVDTLEGVFHNIINNLKTGGRFIGVRDADPTSPVLQTGKYGGSCKWLKEIPGGFRYLCVLHTTPPIEFEGAALEVIYSGSTKIYERFGLTDVRVLPYEAAAVVQQNPEFWESFLERPCLAVMTAVKS